MYVSSKAGACRGTFSSADEHDERAGLGLGLQLEAAASSGVVDHDAAKCQDEMVCGDGDSDQVVYSAAVKCVVHHFISHHGNDQLTYRCRSNTGGRFRENRVHKSPTALFARVGCCVCRPHLRHHQGLTRAQYGPVFLAFPPGAVVAIITSRNTSKMEAH